MNIKRSFEDYLEPDTDAGAAYGRDSALDTVLAFIFTALLWSVLVVFVIAAALALLVAFRPISFIILGGLSLFFL